MFKAHTPLMMFYLVVASMGAILPWYFNIQHFIQRPEEPFTPQAFFSSGFVSPMSSSLTVDFLITTLAVFPFMLIEGRRLGMRKLWIYVLLTFIIAFAFACPLFLYMRERKRKGLSA